MNSAGCLLDTGPLVALLDKSEQRHERVRELMHQFEPPFVTCEAVVTEACFLMERAGRQASQEVVHLGLKGIYHIPFQLQDQWSSIFDLMKKYRDIPISLADACLIRCAEIYEEPRILTFDSDFQIYRWGKNKKFIFLD